MCGRYAMSKPVDDIIQAYVAEGGKPQDAMAAWHASFSLAPTDPVPMVRERADDDGTVEREIGLARWDLRPAWRKDKRPQINARLETVAEKPMFRGAFAKRRAIVPMTGYFEWTGPTGDKTPHFISLGDDELLSAAGLYEAHPVDDGWEISTVVITRTGVDAAGQVHDRMPVFLTEDTWAEWLNPATVDEPGALLAMLDESSQAVGSQLTSWVVDRRVNRLAGLDRRDPDLIAPVD